MGLVTNVYDLLLSLDGTAGEVIQMVFMLGLSSIVLVFILGMNKLIADKK